MKLVISAVAILALAGCASSPQQIDRLPQPQPSAQTQPITIINVPPASAPVINNVIGPAYPPQYQQYQAPPQVYVQPQTYVKPEVYVPDGWVKDYTRTYNRPYSRGVTPYEYNPPQQQSNWW